LTNWSKAEIERLRESGENALTGAAAFNVVSNETLMREAINRASQTLHDPKLAANFGKIRSSFQEVAGARHLNNNFTEWLNGPFLVDSDPRAQASDIVHKNWLGSVTERIEAKAGTSYTERLNVLNEMKSGGPYEDMRVLVTENQSEYLIERGISPSRTIIHSTDAELSEKASQMKDRMISGDTGELGIGDALEGIAEGGLIGGIIGGFFSLCINGYRLKKGEIDQRAFNDNLMIDTASCVAGGTSVGLVSLLPIFAVVGFPVGTLVAFGVASIARKAARGAIEDILVRPEDFIKELDVIDNQAAEWMDSGPRAMSNHMVKTLDFIKIESARIRREKIVDKDPSNLPDSKSTLI